MKKTFHYLPIALFLFFLPTINLPAQNADSLFSDKNFSGFEMRNIGPAFMSGRIADIAINPENDNEWFVAVGSGGVWKTENAAISWTPIFDKQNSYSIGCVTLDPQNPNTVWVGTGENVGGRHVGYGDGIYKSEDGGATWINMGLKLSEHISKIIVHPENSNIIFVAVQGPLWKSGGERGFYKSIDGGKTWKKTLGDEEYTGVTDILIDPRNPDRLYAASWQRHRNVAAYMGGGPNTAIYRSEDGGDTWKKLATGLPNGRMGKIGLAISPQQPDVVYAAIELERRSGSVYRSENRGESWTMMSDMVSGGTGLHYYQELYASPHVFDRIYLMDVRIRVSDNGGKNFKTLKEEYKHSDNHAMAFRVDDPDYLLVGTDGGLYESFDLAENWRFIENLPLTQFYKVALDDAEPFYNVYGGTQDNNTQGGPSRTDTRHGIMNSDWRVILGGDGHQPATEPGNPAIVYAQSQQGYLSRIDMTTNEVVSVRPQPGLDDPDERWNWDSPILVSPHSPPRLYFASQRLWRSDDRGDSWMPVSTDLTLNQERIELPIMGKQQSWDSHWDLHAMSNYNTITSLSESPVKEGLIYAGTDDGLIQITKDGGISWNKIQVASLPGVPATAFVNDIKADLFDENTVYVVLDNHKFGDFKPYIFKSENGGKNWKSISGNIPERTLVWRIVQDHVKQELLFAATEFGIYFTINGGIRWIKITGGLPTISFRDLAIQPRENDLVGASFGRGFYILDDYSALREVTEEQLNEEATLFPARKAWWYIPKPVISFGERGSKGAELYQAPNPPYGAVFTYYLGKDYKTKKQERVEMEKKLNGENIPFPGWDALEDEKRQEAPQILITIKDDKENAIRQFSGPVGKGFHRVAWDLRKSSTRAINVDRVTVGDQPAGLYADPGIYTATISRKIDGVITELSKPINFEVEKLYEGVLKGSTDEELADIYARLGNLRRAFSAVDLAMDDMKKQLIAMEVSLGSVPEVQGDLFGKIHALKQDLNDLDEQLKGNSSRREVGETTPLSIMDRMNTAWSVTFSSTYGPTKTHLDNLKVAEQQFDNIRMQIEDIRGNRIPALEDQFIKAGAPWMRGQPIPER